MDKMVGGSVVVTLVLAVLLKGCIADEPDSNLLITRASREVDLSSPVVEQTVTLSLQNEGANPISNFLFTVDNNLANHLAYIVIETKGKDAIKLAMQETSIKSQADLKTYRVAFPSPLGTQEAVTVVVKSVFTHTVTAHPSEITQTEKQLVQYIGNAYILTPYRCKTQNTDFNVPSSNVESYTRVSPVSTDGSTISYGPYSDTTPYSHFQITLHYENNGPFLGIVSLERLIQVSHWGVIQVEEHVHVRHIGAVLKGSFSRFDYQRSPNSGLSSVKSYVSLLPAAAEDVYYRDEIGNISTSHLRDGEDYIELTIRPRFPLFGGWQTRYYIGYNVPTYEYLLHSGSHFVLKMRFVDHVFDDQIVDELTTRIILPEGSKNIELKTPYKVNDESREIHHTYLDTVGRPVVVAKGYNLVEQHIQDFELYYDFESYLLFQEPLLLVGALLLFFCVIVVVVRLDFSISKDVNALARQQASAAKEAITNAIDNQFRLSKNMLSTIDNFKKNKDAKIFKTTFSDLSKRYKDLGKVIEEQSEQLKDTDAIKIFRKSNDILEALNRLQQLADQVVNARIKQDQYVKEEENTRKRLRNLEDEIEAMVQRL